MFKESDSAEHIDGHIDLAFKYYHELPTSSYMGIVKTYTRISNYFWTKSLKDEVTERVKSCVQCQWFKQAQNPCIGHHASEMPTTPFHFINHINPLPLNKNQNQYLLTAVLTFSKFTLLIPTWNTNIQTNINILNDNVSTSKLVLLAQMCLDFGITRICMSPYYSNLFHAKRVNKNLKITIWIFHAHN